MNLPGRRHGHHRLASASLSLGCACVWALLSSAALGAGPGATRVAYIIPPGGMSGEDSAAVAWLSADPLLDPVTVTMGAGGPGLPACKVVWIHATTAERYAAVTAPDGVLASLRTYLEKGGGIVGTGYAAFLPSDLGIEPVRPTVRLDTLQDDWLWDKKGIHGLHGHPVFDGLFGGEYVEDGTVDRVLPIVGYYADAWPAKGSVVGVEKSYVFLRAGRKVMWEQTAGKGRVVAIGGMIAFAPVNHLRANLEQFMQNTLRYAGGVRFPGPVSHWEPVAPAPLQERLRSKPLRIVTRRIAFPEPADGPVMARDRGEGEMFDLAGRRVLIMGKERGGIDEVWVHPLRIIRDYQAGVVMGDSVLWLDGLTPRVEARPATFTRRYAIGGYELREILFPAMDRCGGAIRYESSVPVRLVIRLRTDLRWMWPYDAGALGTLIYGFDTGLQALRVRDRTGAFVALFGADRAPAAHREGQYVRIDRIDGVLTGSPTADHQVAFAAEYALGGDAAGALTFAFTGTNEGTAACDRDHRVIAGDPGKVLAETAAHYRTLLARCVSFSSPDHEFDEMFRWAIVGTDRFVARTPGVGTGLLAGFNTTARGWNGEQRNSGRPGYAWYFGRDAAWSSFALNGYGDAATVRRQLELYQRWQDRTGKIFHELATSGVVHFDASDATPMYVMLAAHYMRASGDTAFIRASWPSLSRAMEFLFSTDTDGDGLIENTDVGHGWVEPGGVLFGTHSEYYLSVLWVQALESAASMAEVCGDRTAGGRFRAHAARIRTTLEQEFWDPERKFYSHGKLKDGTFATDRTVFPATGMIWGLVADDRAPHLLRAYASSEFSTDWAVRGLSGASVHFNPRGYQEGAAWPLFTGLTALAEYAYGHSAQGFAHIKQLMLIKKHWALGLVQEVMHGSVYRPTGVCFHQCWSETNILHPVMEGLVGWHPDAPAGTALLTPRFPIDWDTVRVERLRMGATLLDLRFERRPAYMEFTLTRKAGPACTVTLSPEIPAGMRVRRVIIDGVPHFQTGETTARGLLTGPPVVRVDSATTVAFEYTGGFAMVPVVPRPEPGDSVRTPRILRSVYRDGAYVIECEGRGGATASFPFRLYGFETVHATGAEVRRGRKSGEWSMTVRFDPAHKGFAPHTVTLRPE